MVFVVDQASTLVWMIVPQPKLSNEISTPLSNKSKQTKTNNIPLRLKYRSVIETSLFGQELVSKPVEKVVNEAPQSDLNYKVTGIYASTDTGLASVIIQKSANNTNLYHIEDEIDHQVIVKQIHPNHILISRHDKLEKLLLEKPSISTKTSRQDKRKAFNSSYERSTQILQGYKKRYATNPLALAKRFKATPVRENGSTIGYKLTALRGEQLLKKLGIRNSDVFVGINGISLEKPFQALDALKSLATANDVTITILRNGNRQSFQYNL